MTPEEAREKAQAMFRSGYNCAQSVVGVFCEELGLDFKTAMHISQPFGGGMGRMREICGSVSGMFMLLGLAGNSNGDADVKEKNACYAEVQKLAREFREKNGSIVCREMLGLVPMGQNEEALKNRTAVTHVIESPESAPRTPEYYKKRPCEHIIGDAAEIFCRWLNSRHND